MTEKTAMDADRGGPGAFSAKASEHDPVLFLARHRVSALAALALGAVSAGAALSRRQG